MLIQWSSLFGAYTIGNGTKSIPNAFGTFDDCPKEIIIPNEYDDNIHGEYKIEVIEQYAFLNCGQIGKTTSVFVSKNIKLIRSQAIYGMMNVVKFTIESGSKLEEIEKFGLGYVGNVNLIKSAKIPLVFPLSLKSVYEEGVYKCNLFSYVLYCGTNELSNLSTLYSQDPIPYYTVHRYPSDNIFGHKTNKLLLVSSKLCHNLHDLPWDFPDHSIQKNTKLDYSICIFVSFISERLF